MICNWATPGICVLKWSGERDAGDEIAARRDDVVGHAAFDLLQQRQPSAAEAGAVAPKAHIANRIAEDRHGPVHQVGDDDRPRLARRAGRAVRPQYFQIDAVGVDVQSFVPWTLAGDQTHLLAAVAVGHRALKNVFDQAALPVVQHHRRRDDAVRAKTRSSPAPHELSE